MSKYCGNDDLLLVVSNCCDISKQMGRAVVDKNLHKVIIESMKNPFFDVKNIETHPQSENITDIIDMLLTVMYHTLRHNLELKQAFRDVGVVNVCLEYLHAS